MANQEQCWSCKRLVRNLRSHQVKALLINCRLRISPHELLRPQPVAASADLCSARSRSQDVPQQALAQALQGIPDPPQVGCEAACSGAEQAAGLAGQQHVCLYEDDRRQDRGQDDRTEEVAAFAQLLHKEQPASMPASAPGKSSAIRCQRQAFRYLPIPAEEDKEDSDAEEEDELFKDLSITAQRVLQILMKLHDPYRAKLLSVLRSSSVNVRWCSCQDLDDYLQRFEVHGVSHHSSLRRSPAARYMQGRPCLVVEVTASSHPNHGNGRLRRQRSGRMCRS